MKLKIILLPILLVVCVMSDVALTRNYHVTFIYTNSLNGILEACQCVANPNGGLVKRGHAISQLKKKYGNTLVMETGDFCSYYPDALLTKYVMRGYKHIKYDAVGIGDQEFASGVDTFHQYSTELPFVCANMLYFAQGTWHSLPKHRIITIGSITVGITSIIDHDAFMYYPSEIVSKIKITDYKAALREEIEKLSKADCIVVLSHLGFEKDKELAQLFPTIALIVGGHSQTLIKKPVKIGNTLIVQAGTNGSRIGVLQAIVADKKITQYAHQFIVPRYEDPDDPDIARLIAEYKEETAKRITR